MPFVTVKIAGAGTSLGTSLSNEKKSESLAGHMWYTLTANDGSTASFGFSPDADHEGQPLAPGDVNVNGEDDKFYQGTDYTQTIEISQDQYDAMMAFGKDPSAFGFDMYYNVLWNSCVDFVWKALGVGGLNPSGYDGTPWPMNNRFRKHFIIPDASCINPDTNTTYCQSKALISPLILDLDGDGIEIRQLVAGEQILFDHDGDGARTGTAWAKADDGLLALDRNGNGTIDSGQELFGNHTLSSDGQTAADGYAALAELDSNGDGFIDAQDALFNQLRVWRDLDQDGISDAGELQSLAETGITRISLGKTAITTTLADGTRLDGLGEFIIDGQTRHYTDAWLAENGFYREFTDTIPLTDAASALPDMRGSGMVRDLREAASLDARLVADIQGLTGEMSRAQMMSALDDLIVHWADTSTMQTTVEQAADKDYCLFYLIPGMSVADWFKIYARTDNVSYATGGTGNGGFTSSSPAEEARLTALAGEHQRVTQMIATLERFNALAYTEVSDDRVTKSNGNVTYVQSFTAQSSWNNWTGGASGIVFGGVEFPKYAYSNVTEGQLALLEESYAYLKKSVYDGLALQTRLKPYLDEIRLVVDEDGIRLDYSALEAKLDTLYASDPVSAFTDTLDLHLRSELSDWNVTLKLAGWLGEIEANGQFDALKAELGDETPSIIQFGGNGNDTLYGDDDDNIIHAGAGNDALYGNDGNDTLIGGLGNDNISAGGGDDTLYGGAGNDTLYGEAGNDILHGEAGNDTLNGGAGDDTYVFSSGDGQDTIYDTGGNDTLRLNGYTLADLGLQRSGSHLIIALGDDDEITLQSYFSSNGYNKIEQIEFADDDVHVLADVLQELPIYLGEGNDNVSFGSGNETVFAGGGNDNTTFLPGAGMTFCMGKAGMTRSMAVRGTIPCWAVRVMTS